MTDHELECAHPYIEWRTPMLMIHTNGARGFACRFCIARQGFKAEQIAALPQTPAPVLAHIAEKHSQ
jgi:hypothetical protein